MLRSCIWDVFFQNRCDEVAEALTQQGLQAAALHGGRSQSEREAALRDFRNGPTRILVTHRNCFQDIYSLTAYISSICGQFCILLHFLNFFIYLFVCNMVSNCETWAKQLLSWEGLVGSSWILDNILLYILSQSDAVFSLQRRRILYGVLHALLRF